MTKQKQNYGFTLIEILVVLSIIGILAGLIMTGFGAARKAARDTQRKSNLAQYKSALESYSANNNGIYPINTYNGNSQAVTGIFNATGPIINEYLPSIINDPTNTVTYTYQYRTDATGSVYVLWSALESGGHWELCSDGRAGNVAVLPTDETCDLP